MSGTQLALSFLAGVTTAGATGYYFLRQDMNLSDRLKEVEVLRHDVARLKSEAATRNDLADLRREVAEAQDKMSAALSQHKASVWEMQQDLLVVVEKARDGKQ